jgi:formylmethanofuran dehydrogenase subunit E
MSEDTALLNEMIKFHGHRCWASVSGLRMGLAARRALGVKRSGGSQLAAVVEIGDDHGGMCFADGVQCATGCTVGKGNLRKAGWGKLGLTLVEKASNRAVRISYKPTLQSQIAESAFMKKRGMGIMPDEIPETEQMELVDLVWNAPEADIMTIEEVFQWEEDWLPEMMGFVPCEACGELVAKAYLRVVGEKHVCIPCSGYDR